MHGRTALPSDIPHLPSLQARAFSDEPYFDVLQPGLKQNEYWWGQYFVAKINRHVNRPRTVMVVVVSDDSDAWWDEKVGEEIMGYSAWVRHGPIDDKHKSVWEQDSIIKKLNRQLGSLTTKYNTLLPTAHDPTYDASVWLAFGTQNAEIGRRVFDPNIASPCLIWLADVAVEPRFQRKGVGKRLLKWGLARADLEGVCAAMWSSVVAEKLYESVGFQCVGTQAIGETVNKGYVRWPGGKGKPDQGEKAAAEVRAVEERVREEGEKIAKAEE